MFMVFNATFNNILVLSFRSVLFAKEIGISGENHRPAATHIQTSSVHWHWLPVCMAHKIARWFPNTDDILDYLYWNCHTYWIQSSTLIFVLKKSLKLQKGKSESVNRRRNRWYNSIKLTIWLSKRIGNSSFLFFFFDQL